MKAEMVMEDLLDKALFYDGQICDVIKQTEINLGVPGLLLVILFSKGRIEATIKAICEAYPDLDKHYDGLEAIVKDILVDNGMIVE